MPGGLIFLHSLSILFVDLVSDNILQMALGSDLLLLASKRVNIFSYNDERDE